VVCDFCKAMELEPSNSGMVSARPIEFLKNKANRERAGGDLKGAEEDLAMAERFQGQKYPQRLFNSSL